MADANDSIHELLPEIPALTTSYEKAHKTYVLMAALLASWQLIGVTLETKEKWGITLKSPSAVPLVLVALVVYFGYKVTIEWMQCNEQRRKNIAAKIDYRVAHCLAATSLLITFVQYISHVQLVDFTIRHVKVWPSVFGLTVFSTVCCLFVALRPLLPPFRYPSEAPFTTPQPRMLVMTVLNILILLPAGIRSVKNVGYLYSALAASIGMIPFAVVVMWLRNSIKLVWRYRDEITNRKQELS